ncbi:hypothetical protein PF005_g23518 [Phytophthora fragariae]|uniref:Major facilitator superfamily (MFS) profile domain-containing protein n=2 Tax=Phytophthora TaxID=4783 RepID=A0A6A3WCK7_9STRA|nr:hypothetical protein PF003_g38930 [Phytophthora fragariae]KAE9000076.1 hypothetical protein PR002_g18280 [Phytophthora rubi]KAE8925552.1 hypothetical protein PF009_g24243 [Phytophthora fragariae]KAE8981112.1 hypothetical protein PF011_g22160 [Phytophthora fragariae]KAE9000540.1 hypothetical protein PR001_g18766 [Phytophthora rubi]
MCLQLGPSLARYLLVARVVTGVVCDASAGISASRGFATVASYLLWPIESLCI